MSNKLGKILQDLDSHVHLFDLDRGAKSLGERAMDVATNVMLDAMDLEQDPDGNRWPDLSEEYAREKARIAPGKQMAELHDVMRAHDQVASERVIVALRATQIFGTTEQAKEEAVWFQEGDPAQNRPPRPFWGFSAEGLRRQDELFEDQLKGI